MFHQFFFQAEDGIRDLTVTGVQTCALPIYRALRVGEHRIGLHADEVDPELAAASAEGAEDRKSTRLNSSHSQISYSVFCLIKKKSITLYVKTPIVITSPTVLSATYRRFAVL